MSLRVVFVAAFAVVALAVACGGGSAIPEDPRVKEIGSVAEVATYAYAGAGAAGLYGFLAPDVAQRCSREQFAQDLVDQEVPTGFRGLKKVQFEEEDKVRVTVILIVREGDKDVEWVFVRGPQDAWYLSQVPGLKECAS